jgi:hypothetical protein
LLFFGFARLFIKILLKINIVSLWSKSKFKNSKDEHIISDWFAIQTTLCRYLPNGTKSGIMDIKVFMLSRM